MTHISQICLYAQAAILERHPELSGLVTFDAHVPTIHRGMHMIELRILALDYERLREIAKSVTPHPFGPEREWPLGKILDHYCTHEPTNGYDFELGGLRWLIGDGDDSLAVTELGPDGITLWVRAWE